MSQSKITRRKFLGVSAASAVSLPILAGTGGWASTTTRKSGYFPVKAIASSNGLEATRVAYEMLTEKSDTLDAVIAGINLVENDPEDITVGYGGLPNEDGVVELDSAVMHGPTHHAGAVASLRGIKNPSLVARLIMEQTDHVLLVGEGAQRFAKAHGFREEDLLTERSRKIWLYWKQTMSRHDDWIPPSAEKVDLEIRELVERITGTIHCTGMNAAGDISCVTTTSGLFFKMPGRVGDSPIIGAGQYVDNRIGSCGSTGRGEANLTNLCSFAAVELMRGGMSPVDAGLEVLRRVVEHTTEPRLMREDGTPDFNLKFYLLSKNGEHAGVAMHSPAQYAITDKRGTRLEDCVTLFD